jgi:uncharacterized protein DUF4288
MKNKRHYRVSEPSTAPLRKSAQTRLKRWDKNVSPVGWYVASYVLRFVELSWKHVNDTEERFLAWENTVLVRARNLSHAYDKTVAIAKGNTKPYKGGREGVDVQWIFEGITEILPVYEQIEDGAEIMWTKYTRKLKTIRKSTKAKSQVFQ